MVSAFFRAADGNRTRDLRTTNATLYRLSHSSTALQRTCLSQSPKAIVACGEMLVNAFLYFCKKLSIKVDKLRWFAYANLCMEIPKDRENRHGRDTLYQRRD